MLAVSIALLVMQAGSPPMTPILAALEGEWKGEGTWLGTPARAEAEWQAALGGAFVKLEYDVDDAAGARQFSGIGYYRRAVVGPGAATWFDSQGSVHAIDASVEGSTLTALWGPAGTPVGRTTYRVAGDRLVIEDAIKAKDGSWRGFSRFEMKRTED